MALPSSRLADYQRDKIRNAILTDTFDGRKKELVKREAALATKVLIDRYGKDCFERFAAIPEGWLPTVNQLNVGFGNHSRTLALEEARALPAEVYHRGSYELPERLGRQLVKLDHDSDQLQKDREKLNADLRKALRQFTTIKALREEWPEAYEHLVAPGDREPVVVPAIRPADVNAEIARMREVA